MKKKAILECIRVLREKAELNKLVVFVGAGVSCNVKGMPNWHALISEMAKAIGYEKCNYCRHSKECSRKRNGNNGGAKCPLAGDYSTDEYLKIPQYVFNKKPKSYVDIIEKCISDRSVPDAPLSKAIFNLNPSHIITTNYDKLLESSESVYRRQYDVIIRDKDLLDATQSKYIIKMHGDISQPDTIVLKEQDYLEYSQKHVLIEMFVKALLTDHTILFLGYSLNDYNIKLIISWINYLRSQNRSLLKDKRRKIGYIVLDEEKDDKNSTANFRANNIEVINIRSLPIVSSVPESLSQDKGKRLYSFLDLVIHRDLDDAVSYSLFMEQTITFLMNYKISDYLILFKLLHISSRSKEKNTLTIYRKEEFDRLSAFLESNPESAEKLKQLFINVGIDTLELFDVHQTQKIELIGKKNSVLENKFFNLYIQNRYSELLSLCRSDKENLIESCFYQHFTIGYDGIESDYETIDFEALSENDQVVFLHNRASLQAVRNYGLFVSTVPAQFIKNMASSSKQKVFQPFLDMYDGEKAEKYLMESTLSQLKSDVDSITTVFFCNDGSISKIYTIQNRALAHYYFYYSNCVFTDGFADAKICFKPYIEAIICANKDNAVRHIGSHGIKGPNKKYAITALDFDIISKYIDTKELTALINSYETTKLNTDIETVQHTVLCFANLVDSLVTSQTFGHQNSSIRILSNLSLLLSKIELSENDKLKLSESIQRLFGLDGFNQRFWSIACTDFKDNIKAFASLLRQLKPCTNIICLQSIISSFGFYEYIVNVNFSAAKSVIRFFINEEDYQNCQTDLCAIIDSTQGFNQKVLLLQIFMKAILDGTKKDEYKAAISKNISNLSNSAVYDFVFNGWVTPSEDDIRKMLKSVLSLYQKQIKNPGVYSYPDSLETKLECVYILHIDKIIPDLSALDEMCGDYPQIDFLLHPDSFDYKKVDFSNYMWENFAYRANYMKYFVAHKADIIPRIQEHIKTGEVSEFEKKILYGFLLHGDEIWEVED